MQITIGKSVALPSLAFSSLLIKKKTPDWTGKPSDWSDIRKDCPANSIALYAGHSSDYSSYDNFGFTATCTGGYKVYIDGTVYGSYASGSTCNITWSTSGVTTGDDITTPSALKAHKIWIEPATEGNNITKLICARVAPNSATAEEQGVLWEHFNIGNTINLNYLINNETSNAVVKNPLCTSITAKNNIILTNGLYGSFANATSLEYLPDFKGGGITSEVFTTECFKNCQSITQVSLSDMKIKGLYGMFSNCHNLENIYTKNVITGNATALNNMYAYCYKLKNIIPPTFDAAITNAFNFIVNAKSLEDTNIDMRALTALKRADIFGNSSYFVNGLKSLRVSNEAPFDHATAPQINVSDTGMDRTALVQLFNDLPTVSGGQIINVTGTTGSEDLTVDDVMIAVNKGWTVTGGPQPIPNWQLGDRLDNKASFVGYFDSVNPDDQSTQRYAYFVVDAQYRAKTKDVNNPFSIDNAPIPVYTSVDDAIAAKESATWTASKLGSFTNYPSFSKCNEVSVTFNGTTYNGVPPNATELLAIRVNRTALDNADPTSSSYSTLNLATWGQGTYGSLYTCQAAPDNSSSPNMTFWKKTNQNNTAFGKSGQAGNSNFTAVACPIIEIPVPAGHGA